MQYPKNDPGYGLYDKFGWNVVLLYEHLLEASAWYRGAPANHQHQADQGVQEDPVIQKRQSQIINSINIENKLWHVKKV